MPVLDQPRSKIIQKALVDAGVGVMGGTAGSWPIFARKEPPSPDNVITVYNTTGRLGRRNQVKDNDWDEDGGIMVRVRGTNGDVADYKAAVVADALDKMIRTGVVIGGTTFRINVATRTGPPLDNGTEPGTTRYIYTVNALVNIEQLP